MNENDILKSLVSNGPWAAAFFFLLMQVIRSWTTDRETLTNLLSEFKTSIDALRVAVEQLKEHVKNAHEA
jgi:hypothetical protein